MTTNLTSSAPADRCQRRWLVWAALTVILTVAVLLRFHGLSAGLRHAPDPDEAIFVESARAMIRAGDLDHRFYEYPGLFIYLLAPVLVFFPYSGAIDPAAYLAARSLVAVFSVASVALVFCLARRLAGVGAALLAAMLMAVAPIEVWTAHMIRSDVVLEAFALASLLWFQRMGDRARDDVWAGVAVGLTAAVKFTGVLIASAYVAARCARSGVRWRRMVLAGAVSALVWFCMTPYALIRPAAYRAGVGIVTDYFYAGSSVAPRFVEFAGIYVRAILKGLSAPPDVFDPPFKLVPVAACALFGLFTLRRAWRGWLPLVVYPCVLILVLATASEKRVSRLALSCVGPLAVIVGAGLAAAVKRSRVLGGTLAALVVAMPLWQTLDAAEESTVTSTMDKALDWVEAHVPCGSRILSSAPRLGLRPACYEVVTSDLLSDGDRAWAAGMDWTIVHGTAPAGWSKDLHLAAVFDDEQPKHRMRIEVLVPRPVAWRTVALHPSWLRASTAEAQLSALLDDNPRTVWQTQRPQDANAWIEIHFPRPQTVDRIEMLIGRHGMFARALDVGVREPGGDWTTATVYPGRPHPRNLFRANARPSQVCLLHATNVSGLRLGLTRGAQQPWSIAELRIEARESQSLPGRP